MREEDKPYIYIWIRKDIPMADQLVQVGHVAMDAQRVFSFPECTSIVLFSVKDSEELDKVKVDLIYKRIFFTSFWEPDDNMQYTAIATEPVYGRDRKRLREYKLWSLDSLGS